MSIDISKIKEGDGLTIRVFATGSVNNCAQTELWAINAMGDHPSEAFRINTHQITAHHPKPKPLAVGDKVKDNGGLVWEIVGQKRSNEAPVEHRVYEYPLWRPLWGFASRHDEAVESWERVS